MQLYSLPYGKNPGFLLNRQSSLTSGRKVAILKSRAVSRLHVCGSLCSQADQAIETSVMDPLGSSSFIAAPEAPIP
jgi:hypothetical protein